MRIQFSIWFLVDTSLQSAKVTKFEDVNMINRRWNPKKTNQITSTYLRYIPTHTNFPFNYVMNFKIALEVACKVVWPIVLHEKKSQEYNNPITLLNIELSLCGPLGYNNWILENCARRLRFGLSFQHLTIILWGPTEWELYTLSDLMIGRLPTN